MSQQSVASAVKECEERTDEKHVLKILCRQLGDDEVEFDPKDKKDIAKAAKKFESAKRDRGMVGFGVDKDGKTEKTPTFDPQKKATVMTPPMRGG